MSEFGAKKPKVKSLVESLNKRVKEQSKIVQNLNLRLAEFEYKTRKKKKNRRTDFTSFSPKTKPFLSAKKQPQFSGLTAQKMTDYKSSDSSMVNDSEDLQSLL